VYYRTGRKIRSGLTVVPAELWAELVVYAHTETVVISAST